MLQPAVNARIVSSRTGSKRQRRADLLRVQKAIGTLGKDLKSLDAVVGGIARELPDPEASFDALAELGEALRCVKTDLLADAIETLDALATLDDAELRRRYEQHQEWLRAAGE